MKALIMAAGYGRRLEPLTIAVPKPMVPIVNLPTMQHNIELLKRYGITEITANIHYHPEQIENYFGDGSSFGVSLLYSYEEKLLGTAGGVRKMGKKVAKINETFVVLSSDALTDINLNKMLDFHRQKEALVTIALTKVADVSEYGVVVVDGNGQITGFQEKPKPQDALSNLANAGIYIFEPEILEMIPEGFHDFGKELFPRLVAEKEEIFGYSMVEYWSDVGCLDKYIQASYDAMKGLVQIRVPGKKVAGSIWIGEREAVSKSARFAGSVVIGSSCQIGENVYIKDCVIGDKCVIKDGAAITSSVIWSDTVIGHDCQINSAVIGSWCQLERKVRVLDGAVIANRGLIGRGKVVPSQARLLPNSIQV
jgi:NDP-sugar pyrophosphorylase family protein